MAKHRFVIEQAALVSATTKIDKKAGVIRGVKVLGAQSRNNARVLGLSAEEFGDAVDKPYRYGDDVLVRAAELYSGVSVYSDHLEFGYTEDGARFAAQEAHPNESLIGWLEDARVVPGDGVYADLHCLKTHPFYPVLLEIAQKRPDKLALSHEAGFDSPHVVDGSVVLGEITRVDGVALINNTPGTTSGLFESAGLAKTIRAARIALVGAAAAAASVAQIKDALKVFGVSVKEPVRPAHEGGAMDVSKKGSLAAAMFGVPIETLDVASQVRAKSRRANAKAKKPDVSRKGSLAEAIQQRPCALMMIPAQDFGGVMFGD